MAKTIVIKGANFSINKLDTITWVNQKPCTALHLNKNSTNVKFGAPETLVASVTPSDTTDSILWASSDTSVVTVSDGVVTAVGLGSATITVTCGSHSDTCAVTATADIDTADVVKLVGYQISKVSLAGGSNGYSSLQSSESRGVIFSNAWTRIMKEDVSGYTPKVYKMPNNTTHVKITPATGISVNRIGWYNTSYTKDWDGTTVCAQIGMTENPSAVNGVVTVEVPSYQDYPTIDSLIISLYDANGFSQYDFQSTTIEFVHLS